MAKNEPKENKAIEAAKKFVAGLPKEKQKLFEATLADAEAAEALGKSVLMQGDYTQRTQMLTEKERKAEDELKRLKGVEQQQREWHEKNRGRNAQLLEENEKYKTRAQKLEARIGRLAETYGVPEEEIKDIMESTGKSAEAAAKQASNDGSTNIEAAAHVGAAGGDKPQYATAKDLEEVFGSSAQLSAQFHDISRKHAKLFPNQELSVSELLKEATQARNDGLEVDGKPVTLQSFWAHKYRVTEREQELADEARESEIQRRVQEERAKWDSEAAANGTSFSTSHSPRNTSPLFDKFQGVAKREDGDKAPPDPMRGVTQATGLFEQVQRGEQVPGVNAPDSAAA